MQVTDLVVGKKVRIRKVSEMYPKFMDEIGRLHFDLGDGTTICFDIARMGGFCNLVCEITDIYTYTNKDGKPEATFKLKHKDYPVDDYTFSLGMVDDDIIDLDNWMKIETETIYGEKVIILYDSSTIISDEDLNKQIDLASMYRNRAIEGEHSKVIVLDENTYTFWSAILKAKGYNNICKKQ